jgi:hypothetical protein
MKKIIILLAIILVTAAAFITYDSSKSKSTNNEGIVETVRAGYDSSLTQR